MKQSCAVYVMGAVLAGSVLISGCSTPELAQTPYGPTEEKWSEFMKTNYPEWKAPRTVPPNAESDLQAGAIILPEEIPAVDIPEAGNLEVKEEVAGEVKEPQTYIVEKGDTLWKIANKFYGDGKKWQIIFEANQDIIGTPDKIRAGITIKIPAQ